MKTIIVAFLVFSLSCFNIAKAESPPVPENTVEEISLLGEIDVDMLNQVKNGIKAAQEQQGKIKTLRITISSPGGSALGGLEIGKIIRDASDNGIVVQIKAEILCASACTFVLASGTPGYRYVTSQTLILVHGLQSNDSMTLSCHDYKQMPTTQDDKIANVILDMIHKLYSRLTGKSLEVVRTWTICGNEQAGGGELAVKLGLADHVVK